MFERYTEKARRVVFFARYEAAELGSPYIETEHLLLGIIREGRTVIADVFGNGKAETIREEILQLAFKGTKSSTSVDLPLSNECKRVLAYAAEEAERAGDKHIGVEHQLLGLARESGSVAGQFIRNYDLTIEVLRKKLLRALSERDPALFYCPNCARSRNDPLTCGDCSAVICRVCGTPLESPDELGIG